jgi:hypothetical protein
MDITGEGVGVYAEAKGEYTKQLCQHLLPVLQQYFLDMLEDAKQKEPEAKKVLLQFQQLFEGVPDWNADKVQRETTALAASTQCDYLEELLTAVFIAHTKVLSAIRLSLRQKKLHITIPKLDHFLHRTLIECSRLLWSNTYLFSMNSPSIERQKNLRQIEAILHDGIQQAIRSMLPVKNILREYLREEDDDEVEEEDTEPVVEPKPEPVVEPKPEPVVEPKPEPVVEPEVKLDKSRPSTPRPSTPRPSTPRPSTPRPSTPETTPVVFTGIDTSKNAEPESVEEFKDLPDTELGEEDEEEEITILEGSPEPMDGFEELDKKDDVLQMEFEELT